MIDYKYESLIPVKIVKISPNVSGAENLFKEKEQVFFYEREKAVIDGKGYIIFDFGKEYFGMLKLLICQITSSDNKEMARIRLGESLSECCAEVDYKGGGNYHGYHDTTVQLTQFSEYQTNFSGFRFARIDFFGDCKFELINCKMITREEPFADKGGFECDDSRINEIFDTAFRTVEMCRQNGVLWEGIKRDRLVWVGDMHTEALSLMMTLGEYDRVYRSLKLSKNDAPVPSWINGIPAYSLWYIVNIWELYLRSGNKEYLDENRDYIVKVLKQVDYCIDEDGAIDFKRAAFDEDMGLFLDWSTFGTADAETGLKSFAVYALNIAGKVLNFLHEDISVCERIKNKIKDSLNKVTTYKQVKAFQCLAKDGVSDKDLSLLVKGGADGWSCFMNYYICKCLSMAGETSAAFNAVKEYYGAMLDLGATTFWEDFDMQDVKDNPLGVACFEESGVKNIHADYGKFCFQGFRHSLCHGWSTGLIPFLFEEIAGVKLLQAGYKQVSVKPQLCGLKFIRASMVTPYGKIELETKNKGGVISLDYNCPKEIQIIN